jgi:hypothetical protein
MVRGVVLLCGGVVAAIAIGDRELLCGDFRLLMPAAVCAGVCAYEVRYKHTQGQISRGRFVLHMHISCFDWCMCANRISPSWAGSGMKCKSISEFSVTGAEETAAHLPETLPRPHLPMCSSSLPQDRRLSPGKC